MALSEQAVLERARQVRALVLDVDGVLTRGQVTYDDTQSRSMAFDIHDGCALKTWRRAGGRVGLLSGRRTGIVVLRARELGIEACHQGIEDKGAGLKTLLSELGVSAEATCYVGDDLPDIPALRACGFAVAVANAVPTVKRYADYVTMRNGGAGAVAEVIELLLRKRGRWSEVALK